MVTPLQRADGKPPRVIVAGGGVAALETVLALRALAGMRVELELIAPDADLRYPPLEVLEPFGATLPRIGLAGPLEQVGALLRRDAVVSVDRDARTVSTRTGELLTYDALVLAVGARRQPTLPGALVFGDAAHRDQFAALLDEAQAGVARAIVFAVPRAASWPLPLYELALLAAHHLATQATRTALAVVTPERAPLEIFGSQASDTVRERLRAHGIELVCDAVVERILEGEVRLAPDGTPHQADRVVTIPALTGAAVPGVPHDADGFLPIDRHGTVIGADDVYAAGDATDTPVKQGGLATQQADAIAELIAARVGAPVQPSPFEPVLRGMLLTGGEPQYLEADRRRHVAGAGAWTPLWWPPTKVAGRYLGPLLAAASPIVPSPADAAHGGPTLPVEIAIGARSGSSP